MKRTIITIAAIVVLIGCAISYSARIGAPIAKPKTITITKLDDWHLKETTTREEILPKDMLIDTKADLEREITVLQKELDDVNSKLALFN